MLSSPRCSNESLPLLVRVVEWSSYKDEFLTGGLRENLKVAVQEKGRGDNRLVRAFGRPRPAVKPRGDHLDLGDKIERPQYSTGSG